MRCTSVLTSDIYYLVIYYNLVVILFLKRKAFKPKVEKSLRQTLSWLEKARL